MRERHLATTETVAAAHGFHATGHSKFRGVTLTRAPRADLHPPQTRARVRSFFEDAAWRKCPAEHQRLPLSASNSRQTRRARQTKLDWLLIVGPRQLDRVLCAAWTTTTRSGRAERSAVAHPSRRPRLRARLLAEGAGTR